MSNSVRPHKRQPTRLPRPWDSPGKNTGVGCHFLLQCRKVKSESEVTQSCLTFSDPMDCSLPGSSVHGIFQARVLEWVAIAFCLVYFQLFYTLVVIKNWAIFSLTFLIGHCGAQESESGFIRFLYMYLKSILLSSYSFSVNFLKFSRQMFLSSVRAQSVSFHTTLLSLPL